MAKKQTKGLEVKTVAEIGAGVAALGAAAYLLFGPNSKKNQKALRGWAVKMKGEMIEKFEEAKELTEPVYNSIVEKIEAKYAKAKNINPEELADLVKETKKQWKSILKEAGGKKVKKVAKK